MNFSHLFPVSFGEITCIFVCSFIRLYMIHGSCESPSDFPDFIFGDVIFGNVSDQIRVAIRPRKVISNMVRGALVTIRI